MADIAQFLGARYAEEKRQALAARGAGNGRWYLTDWTPNGRQIEAADPDQFTIYDEGGHDEHQALHIATWDPARVLADLEAKRAILAEVLSWKHDYIDGDTWFSCAQAVSTLDEESAPGSGCADEDRAGGPCDCGLDRRRATILHAMAAPYAEHADHKPSWSVE